MYYAFVSNLSFKNVLTLLKVTLFGGVLTALWGLPSHFGYDPTCLVFRGTLDTACWTEAFRPTIRVFSTLGQPAWFAAYLATLIPIALAFALIHIKKNRIMAGVYIAVALLFYANLIYTNTRAGFLAFIAVLIVLWTIIFIKKFFTKQLFLRYFLLVCGLFLLCTFFVGSPFEGFRSYTLVGLSQPKPSSVTSQKQIPQPPSKNTQETPPSTETSITDSGTIRQYVWKGAIDAWKANALFGTGVETFAFAYYKFRPVGHNLTSEWDYLYNKAHNEYLNYLTTTGLFGLGTYLAFILVFSFLVLKPLLKNNQSMKQSNNETNFLVTGLFAGWISILITNFFGFSVVIMNLFLFLIPVFIFILNDMLSNKENELKDEPPPQPTPYHLTIIVILICIATYWIISLIRYWHADVQYALGANLDRVGSYQEAYPLLLEAAQIKSNEPVYKDELAINIGVLATALAQNNEKETASQFASNAIQLNDEVITKHPNNVVYWKNRVRLFYTLAQAVAPEQQLAYFQEALKAIQHAAELAPTDAKISYNLGVLYGQTGNIEKAIETLHRTIELKPNYPEAYFALGLFYRQASVNEHNQVVNQELNNKAIAIYKDMLKRFNPQDEEVLKSLKEWGARVE